MTEDSPTYATGSPLPNTKHESFYLALVRLKNVNDVLIRLAAKISGENVAKPEQPVPDTPCLEVFLNSSEDIHSLAAAMEDTIAQIESKLF